VISWRREIHRRRQDPMQPVASQFSQQLEALKVLIVDDESTMRKVTKSLLQVIGVKTIYEACDGRSGLEAICRWAPDVVILDWSMPSPNDRGRSVRMAASSAISGASHRMACPR